jgi:NADH dehydrogenase FAD-containing subunit
MKRSDFLKNIGLSTLGLSILKPTFGSVGDVNAEGKLLFYNTALNPVPGSLTATGRVIIVGGGMAGTTAAKFLKLWGGSTMSVTLIEPNATYYSNIFSNMVLTGEKTLTQLAFNYNNLVTNYGVSVVNKSVTSINVAGKTVTLSDGTTRAYDRLILALGIAFDEIPNFTGTATNKAKIVHAWQAGAQTTSLKTQIQNMVKTDTFILAIPPKPYRCPPGPYERACVVADYLKRKKGGGRVIVLDANPGIQAEPTNFNYAFTVTHTNITYVPNATILSLNADTRTIVTTAGTYTGKVINVIPKHKAPALIFNTGLNNSPDGRWAAVNELSYESTAFPGSGIHVIGDSCYTAKQPKAGHIANAEAKVCTDAILQLLSGGVVNPSPVTNSSCFTPITSTIASWLAAVYKYDGVQMSPVGGGAMESNGANSHNYEDMKKWFNNLMADTGFTPTAM